MKRVIALGFFDGVHLGHGELIKKASEMASEMDCIPSVITFDIPPMNVVRDESVRMIASLSDRKSLIKELYGIHDVITLSFDDRLMHTSPEDFFKMLVCEYAAVGMVCGDDFRFGYEGKGNAELLCDLCGRNGIACSVVEEYCLHGKRVSSSLIREAVLCGDIELANEYMGHPYVMTGDARRENAAGFPSVRIVPDSGVLLPLPGLYDTRIVSEDGTVYGALTGVGENATVSRIVSGNLENVPRRLRIDFMRFIEQ